MVVLLICLSYNTKKTPNQMLSAFKKINLLQFQLLTFCEQFIIYNSLPVQIAIRMNFIKAYKKYPATSITKLQGILHINDQFLKKRICFPLNSHG